MVRPRGWHLEEKNILVDGSPLSGSLMDFGLYFFHNAKRLTANGSGPYFYLPKLENHLEAQLWNESSAEASCWGFGTMSGLLPTPPPGNVGMPIAVGPPHLKQH